MAETGKTARDRLSSSQNMVIAVGRSGGHIFPALGVAEALQELAPHLKIHFIHGSGPLERKIFSAKDYPAFAVPSLALAGGSRVILKLKTLALFPFVFIKVFFFLLRLKPRAVFGTGGATSAPALLSAFLLGGRRAVWEGNAVPGLTNRLLSPFVSAVFTVFPNIPYISQKKQILCGYPFRRSFGREFFREPDGRGDGGGGNEGLERGDVAPSPLALKKGGGGGTYRLGPDFPVSEKPGGNAPFELTPGKRKFPLRRETGRLSNREVSNKIRSAKTPTEEKSFNILVLGGSGGSRRLNRTVSSALSGGDWPKDVFVFHQTGERDFPSLQDTYKKAPGAPVRFFAFSPEIRNYYEKCDVVFSRAGSGAIAEISAMGKPLVLVPLSGTAGDHQVKNARRLVEKGGAEGIPEKEFTPEAFRTKVLQLKNDRKKRELLAQNIKRNHRSGGAFAVARFLLREKGG